MSPASGPSVPLCESSGVAPVRICRERRAHRRYPIHLELQYKLLIRSISVHTGAGRILDMSSSGVLFEAQEGLPLGALVELSIQWPLLLLNSCRLKLRLLGRVVRNDERGTAISTDRYEFRTCGVRPV